MNDTVVSNYFYIDFPKHLEQIPLCTHCHFDEDDSPACHNSKALSLIEAHHSKWTTQNFASVPLKFIGGSWEWHFMRVPPPPYIWGYHLF